MFGRQSKFLMWINYRIRVTIQDNRVLIGTFLAFDKHMNLVLADTEEYSHFKSKKNKVDKERKRSMGLVLLRGDSIISISAESPPSQNTKRFNEMPNPGIGIAQAIGRGLTNQQQAQPGLGSIGRGVGIPNMMAMVPPQPIGRGMPPRMPMPPTTMRNVPLGMIRPPMMPPPMNIRPPVMMPPPTQQIPQQQNNAMNLN
jgi:small nuclear ribonucleoprotein B and B'